jgi:hypothetical protein
MQVKILFIRFILSQFIRPGISVCLVLAPGNVFPEKSSRLEPLNRIESPSSRSLAPPGFFANFANFAVKNPRTCPKQALNNC